MVKKIAYSSSLNSTQQPSSSSSSRFKTGSQASAQTSAQTSAQNRYPESSQDKSRQNSRSVRYRHALLIATALIVAGLIPLSWIILQTAMLRQKTAASQAQLQTDGATGLVAAIQAAGQNRSYLPWQILPEVQANLLNAVQTARETNRLTLKFPVTAVSFSPDGGTIAAADEAGDIHLWDRQGKQQILEGDGQRISAINFSPDGAALFGNSAETLGTAQFWRLNDATDYQAPAQDNPTAVGFSSDGQMLISGNDSGRVRLWDRSGSAIARLYPQQLGPITSVGFNGPAIVSGDETGRISLWSNKGTALGQLWAGAPIHALRLDQNGQRIISQDANRQQAFLWDSQRQTWNQFLLGTTQTVQSADLSSDQQIVANGKTDGSLTLRPLDPQNRRVLTQSLTGHQGAIASVAFSSNNRRLLTGGEDSTVRLWDLQDGLLISRYALQEWTTAPLGSMALSPDGQQIALSSGSRISIGNSKQQARLQIVDPFQNSRLAFRPDGKEIVAQTTNRNGTASFSLQDKTGKETARFSIRPDAPLFQFALSPDGQRLASLSQNGTIQLWNRQGQAMATAPAPAATQFLAFSPDGRRLLSGGSQASQTCLWAIQGNQLQPQSCQAVASHTVAFSRDGKQVALGLANGRIGLWNLRDPITSWQAGQSPIVALAFSGDGEMIASGSADGQIRFSMLGKTIGQPLVGHRAVQSLAFNDRELVSLGTDGEVRLWRANWQDWLTTACQRVADHPLLTQAETPAERSAQAICAGVSSPATEPVSPPPPSAAETRLVVKLSERRVYLYQGDQLQANYPIAVGKAGWETPTGSFRVFSMLEHPGWTNPLTGTTLSPGNSNPLGSRWIAFWNDGVDQIGFHATPDRASVGKAVSHGCLRMYDEDARALYEHVKLGTWVTVQP